MNVFIREEDRKGFSRFFSIALASPYLAGAEATATKIK